MQRIPPETIGRVFLLNRQVQNNLTPPGDVLLKVCPSSVSLQNLLHHVQTKNMRCVFARFTALQRRQYRRRIPDAVIRTGYAKHIPLLFRLHPAMYRRRIMAHAVAEYVVNGTCQQGSIHPDRNIFRFPVKFQFHFAPF